MGFFEHIDELRGTLIKSVIVFLVITVLLAVFLQDFNDLLRWPLRAAIGDSGRTEPDLRVAGPMEIFNVLVQMCLTGGLCLSSPFILYFLGQFVGPALTDKERRIVVPVCAAALILFLLGAAFAFFLLIPSAIEVSMRTSEWLNFKGDLWDAQKYYGFVIWMVAGVGATFEFPLIIVLLVWLGLTSTAFLRKYRRHAVVLILVIASVVTPTTDPWNLAFLACPMYLLYEVAILVAASIERRKRLSGAL